MPRTSPGQPTKKTQASIRARISPFVDPIQRTPKRLKLDRDAGDELKDHALRAKIVAMRTRDGFTPEYIAEKLNIPRSTVIKYIDWAIHRFNTQQQEPERLENTPVKLPKASKTSSLKKSKKKKTSLAIPGVVIAPARWEDRKFQREVFYLRRSAIPIAEIADLIAATEIEVERAIHLYVTRLNESETNDIEIARRTQVEQIDASIRAIMPYATGLDEQHNLHRLDFSAIDRLVKLMEAKSKLLGLNVPQRIDIRTRLEVIAEEGEYDLDELLSIYQEVIKELPVLTAASKARTSV